MIKKHRPSIKTISILKSRCRLRIPITRKWDIVSSLTYDMNEAGCLFKIVAISSKIFRAHLQITASAQVQQGVKYLSHI